MQDAGVESGREAHELAQALRKRLVFGNRRGAVGRIEPHAALLGLGLVGRDLPFRHGALQQEPGGDLHQAGGEPHALAGIDEAGLARQVAGFLAARAVEIGRRLLDKLHALLEQGLEGVGTHETLPEPDRIDVELDQARGVRSKWILLALRKV